MGQTDQDKPNHPEYLALRSLCKKLTDCVEHIIQTAMESGQTEYTVPYEIITDKTDINVEFNDAILSVIHEMLLERPELSALEASEKAFYLSNTRGLDIEWTPGTAERLIKGTPDREGDTQPLKKCRIWQLRPDVNPRMKFMEYCELLNNFGELDPDNYRQVYDDNVGTHNLDAILIKFTVAPPPGYKGHRPSTSDIIELYDTSGSSFFYQDGSCFRKISFHPQEQELNRGQTMGI